MLGRKQADAGMTFIMCADLLTCSRSWKPDQMSGNRFFSGACLLHMVGVQEHDVAALIADKIQAARGPASDDASALRPTQHSLKLGHIHWIHLQVPPNYVACDLGRL